MSTEIKKMAEPLMLDIPALNDSEFLKEIIKAHAVIGLESKERSAEEKQHVKALSAERLAVLKPQDGLQLMLAAQMSAIHELQQNMAYTAALQTSTEQINCCINAVIKLSNVFIQQTNMLAKLQGRNQQKVTVEHVNVYAGGQAVVGTVAANAPISPGVGVTNRKP